MPFLLIVGRVLILTVADWPTQINKNGREPKNGFLRYTLITPKSPVTFTAAKKNKPTNFQKCSITYNICTAIYQVTVRQTGLDDGSRFMVKCVNYECIPERTCPQNTTLKSSPLGREVENFVNFYN